MAGIIRRTAPAGAKGKPPASVPKEGEVLPPTTASRLSIGDVIAIAQEATAFMREAAGYLSEREKTRQALIQSQHELERINADLEKERLKHEGEMRRLDQDDKDADILRLQLADLREGIRPLLAELANLDHLEAQKLMAILDKIIAMQGNLLEQRRR